MDLSEGRGEWVVVLQAGRVGRTYPSNPMRTTDVMVLVDGSFVRFAWIVIGAIVAEKRALDDAFTVTFMGVCLASTTIRSTSNDCCKVT